MFDKDGNGALSIAEVRAGAQVMFAKVDTNKDGSLSQDEMRAHHRMMAGAHGRGGHHGDHGPPPGDGAPPRGERGPMNMDTNGDGAISLAEAQSTLEGHFARADANRDGSVTREEMETAHRAMRDVH
jgi:Ca2+-binding EF-hand superfamily protein